MRTRTTCPDTFLTCPKKAARVAFATIYRVHVSEGLAEKRISEFWC